jgi:hypothetical protein
VELDLDPQPQQSLPDISSNHGLGLELNMGDVIEVTFGLDRSWEEIGAALRTQLMDIGTRLGDDPELLEAKAQRVLKLIRDITEQRVRVSVNPQLVLPADLSMQQAEMVKSAIGEAVRVAAEKCIHAANEQTMRLLIVAIYDLCTSSLAHSR